MRLRDWSRSLHRRRRSSKAAKARRQPGRKNVYVAVFDSDSVTVFTRNTSTGALTELSSPDACVSETGSGGTCANGMGLSHPSAVAISPDGKNVYAASEAAGDGNSSVAVFSRDATTGKLTQLGGGSACVSDAGTNGCADGRALQGADQVVVSPDGNQVYISARVSGGIAVFNRDATTGALTQPAGSAGCYRDDGGESCANGTAITSLRGIAISPDGASVYTTSQDDAIAAFSRNTSTGALTQLTGTAACVSETGSGGACADGLGLDSAWLPALSPDGSNVYVVSPDSSAVAEFIRNTSTGALTQLSSPNACVSNAAIAGCTTGVALDGAIGIGISPDGNNVYVAAQNVSAVAVLSRTAPTISSEPAAPVLPPDTVSGGPSGSALTTSGSGSVAVNGGSWWMSWGAGTFAPGVTVNVMQTTNTGGGGGFALGDQVLSVSATGPLSGILRLRFPPWSVGLPVYSADGVSWRTIPRLSSPSLPDGQQDGYYVNPDGTIDVYTRHLSFFGVLRDAQAPSAPTELAASYATGKLSFGWKAASDNIGIARYRLRRDAAEVASVVATTAPVRAWPGKYSLTALDAAGNESPASTVTVTSKPRPKGVPKRVPLWAYQLLAGKSNAKAPKPLPTWYAAWRAWRLRPYTIR